MRADVKTLFASLKILIVEDSGEMRRLLEALLISMGVQHIISAGTAQHGLRLFSEITPDLVITDGAMQPMDGYEMTRRIRRMNTKGNGAHVPVLMISGISDVETITRARDEGVTDYLVKPVSPQLLYERILNAIVRPIHVVERSGYFGPSPKRRLIARTA